MVTKARKRDRSAEGNDTEPQVITDRKGRLWKVQFDEGAIERIKSQTEFPITAVLLGDRPGLERLVSDPVALIEVLYAICEPQIIKASLSPEEFGTSFIGDQLFYAAGAVVKALESEAARRKAI